MRLIPMTGEMGDRCVDTYSQIFGRDNRPGVVRLFPHVADTLAALYAHGYTLTIATSRHRESLMEFLQGMQIDTYFRYIVTVSDVAQAKPHPDMVLQTMEYLSIAPADTLMVGDAVYDIQMGHNAGVHTCGVTYGNGTRADMVACQADHIIDDFGQLGSLLL